MELMPHKELQNDFSELYDYLLYNISGNFADSFKQEYQRVYAFITNHPTATQSLSLHYYYQAAIFLNPSLKSIRYKTFKKKFINSLYHFPDIESKTNYILALLTTTVGEQFFVDTLSTREQTKQAA
jgi:hypothetical protein